ncbi:MAG: hypothetical protein H6666_15915 [Ardenticatenaceae bacterium]|nr:hypothetical protein [Ardenticatenaceae bacterium]
MIILDENYPESQRLILAGWRIAVRQVGQEVGRDGMQDEEIIALLHQLTRPTFFTLDADFFHPTLRHARYCLVFLDVDQYEAATFVRRTLRHEVFDTTAKRMGHVLRVAQTGITSWRLHEANKAQVTWA